MKRFKRRAHRLLNILADYVKLPESAAVEGVVLLSDHPVKSGGSADVYRAQCTKPDGEEVNIALKVLRFFQDQSVDDRRVILERFAREAIVWHYLEHPNIVPFLGVDGTTFPSPSMTMVSS
ncbi:hypothetical protein FB451DRAFT_1049620 [Mycena latifolia]|nr:hypothetical protein FB451DRAFT_1049620 [Mycena latifolia]